MSLENLYGTMNQMRPDVNHLDRELQLLWSRLAPQNIGTPEFQPNNGLSQRKNEIIELWKLFKFQSPKIILEIGTAQGGTFAGWCQLASNDATIISIDRCVDDCRPRPGDPVHPVISPHSHLTTSQGGGTYHLGREGQRIFAINGWSHEDSTLQALDTALMGRKIDFIFHDASHSKEMFEVDWKLYWPYIADGGVFSAHDVMPSSHPDCDKSAFWQKIRETEEYSAIYEYFSNRKLDSMGIGVVIK